MRKQVIRYIYMVLGTIFLVLGVIGIFIPVLPTTPFLLLTAFCYLRSSEKMYNWLINHKTFGPSIRDYMEKRALKKSTKVKAISTLWLSLCLSIALVQKVNVSLILLAVGIGVTAYLLSLKTMKESEMITQEG